MQETLQKVKKKADDSYALLAGLSTSHEILKDKVNDLSYELCAKISLAQHQEAASKTQGTLEEIKKEIQVLRDHKDSLTAKIRLLDSEIKELMNGYREVLCEQYDLKNAISEVDKKIRPSVDQVFETMHERISSAKKHISEKVDSIVVPKDTVNMDQVKAQIEHQVEPVWLDARNALLTSKNHELRLSILEKKIENALLQLKNIELVK